MPRTAQWINHQSRQRQKPANFLVSASGTSTLRSICKGAGWLLALAGLLIYPLGSAWSAMAWSQMEVFGVSPEPTSLVCLGLLLARPMPAPPIFRWVLAIIPSASLLVSAATLRAMAQI